jgi:RNA polymerase sporulation-specific sigma factor
MLMSYEEMLVKGDVESILSKVRGVCATKLELRRFNSYTLKSEDVVQEVLMQVYNKIKEYDAAKARFSTFIDTIVENKITDCFRVSNRKCNKIVAEAASLDTEYGKSFLLQMKVAQATLYTEGGYGESELHVVFAKTLSKSENKVLSLILSGYKQNEIAKRINYTPARVCQIMGSIRKKVKKII